MTAEKILAIARAELGTKESPANSNRVKYNTAYYGREVSGSNYAWCCAFVWWVFRQTGASSLFYGGGKTAYCPTLKNFHKKQAVTGDYKPGDIIFFNFSGKQNASHVGICESWDGSNITTIDGNTGTGNEANGGAVMRRKRAKKYIVGAYRPEYLRKEDTMTEAQIRQLVAEETRNSYTQFLQYMEQYRQDLCKLPSPEWAAISGELDQAIALGITDGSRPQDSVTRAEAAAMVMRALKVLKGD